MDRNETIIYYNYLNEYLLEYDLLPLLEKHKPAAKTCPYTPMLNNQVNASQCISGNNCNLFKIESKISMADTLKYVGKIKLDSPRPQELHMGPKYACLRSPNLCC